MDSAEYREKPTFHALQGSIDKWKAIRDDEGEDQGGVNCPLCKKFYRASCYADDGKQCPVAFRTGRIGCMGTPFETWVKHHDHEHINYNREGSTVCKCHVCRGIANVEVRFLQSLVEGVVTEEWAPISTAPKDREIQVFCPEKEGLLPMVSRCKWHPDAGFCVDELREPTLWAEISE